MNKMYLLFFITFFLITSSCNGKQNTESNQETKSGISSQTDLPKSVDLKQDISKLAMQDLRLLRNYVYASHGMYFMEADLNAFFRANTSWYEELANNLDDEGKLPLSYDEITLMSEEQAFVAKIDKRIEDLRKKNYHQVNNYKLGNTQNIANLFQFRDIDKEFADKIRDNNFVITSGANQQLFHVYEENDYQQLPSFITTDLYLQAFHMYFSYILKSLEQEQFIPILKDLTLELYNQSMTQARNTSDARIKSISEFNATYYAIPYFILTKQKLAIPEKHKGDFEKEIENINNEEDNISEFMSFKDAEFPYSLFKPRGHYTRKDIMKDYFKAMMWLQTAVFCRDDNAKLEQCIYSSFLLSTAKNKEGKSLMSLYKSIYDPIVFLIGESDNLSFTDISTFLGQQKVTTLDAALTPNMIGQVNSMLIELAKTKNQIKPKIEVSCPDKINFMPQRYLIDNDVLQNLVDVRSNSKRAYPRGLDIFAAFGSTTAMDVLNNFYKEKDNWDEYPAEMKKMQAKFNNFKGWNNSVYNKWIESLQELQKTDKNYPEFMQTKAWDYKNLNTSLASWAELKHDAILYGEQPMSAECGGGGLPAPIVRGYVEPNLKFWNKMDELVKLTSKMLSDNSLLSEDLQSKTTQLNDYITFLITVTEKQLKKQFLEDSEYQTIQYMGSSIEYFTLSIIDPGTHFDKWAAIEGPDKSVAVVADIYTRNIMGCDKSGILHVATGNANNIYVVVEIEGYLYLTKGATFSYYEFPQPIGTRLTDEEWQKMLEEKKNLEGEKWMNDIIIDKEPKVDERTFYSSGC